MPPNAAANMVAAASLALPVMTA
jgi:hypothetical protein